MQSLLTSKINKTLKIYAESLARQDIITLLGLHHTPIIIMDKNSYFPLKTRDNLSSFFEDVFLTDPTMTRVKSAEFMINKIDWISNTLFSCYVTMVFYDENYSPLGSKLMNIGCLITNSGDVKVASVSFESGNMFATTLSSYKIQDGYVKYVV